MLVEVAQHAVVGGGDHGAVEGEVRVDEGVRVAALPAAGALGHGLAQGGDVLGGAAERGVADGVPLQRGADLIGLQFAGAAQRRWTAAPKSLLART